MSTNRWIPVIAAAWLAAGTACSDSLAPADHKVAVADQPGTQISIIGIVHLTTDLRSPYLLTTDDGREIELIGANLASVARVDQAVVEVRGTWAAEGAALDVSDFVVRSVEGEPAMDGILVALYDESGQDIMPAALIGYALQLTRGGTIALTDLPADLVAHLGERVWVTGDPTAAPTAFGFIQ